MFYVKYFTHVHFIGGRTDTYYTVECIELSNVGLAPARPNN